MKINVGIIPESDVIEFEPFLGENIEVYEKAFWDWYTKNYTIYDYPEHTKNKIVDGDLIVEWMNKVAPECNARVIQRNVPFNKADPTLPQLYV